jgi:hypothetical protein
MIGGMSPFNKFRVIAILIVIGFMAACVLAQRSVHSPWHLAVDGIAAIAAILAARRAKRWFDSQIEKERAEFEKRNEWRPDPPP